MKVKSLLQWVDVDIPLPVIGNVRHADQEAHKEEQGHQICWVDLQYDSQPHNCPKTE